MNRSSKSFWGIVLVVLGVLMILNNLNLFSFSWLWSFSAPVVLFVIAFFFVAGFLSKGPTSAGLLVPGGILAGVGLTLLFGSSFHMMEYVWPGFVAAPALGLLLLYLFSNEHSPGLLVPIGILGTVSITCFLSSVLGLWGLLWPGFILAPAVGLMLLYIFGEHQSRGTADSGRYPRWHFLLRLLWNLPVRQLRVWQICSCGAAHSVRPAEHLPQTR